MPPQNSPSPRGFMPIVEELLLGDVVDDVDDVVLDEELVRLELELVVELMLDELEDVDDESPSVRRSRAAVTLEPLAATSVRPVSVMLPSL